MRKATVKPQWGNTYGQKYDPRFAWYVKRMAHDVRFGSIEESQRQFLAEHIASIWTGVCSISGVPLYLRDIKGKAGTTNKFQIASIDRIQCSLPYQIGNVQWVSHAMNQARGSEDLDKFLTDFRTFMELVK